jgi:hypothetical protein
VEAGEGAEEDSKEAVVKYVGKDHTFVYYYAISPHTGESHGLRFSKGAVSSFRGLGKNPETLPSGDILNLPVDPDGDLGTLHDAIAEIIAEHPEVSDLLARRTTLDQVIPIHTIALGGFHADIYGAAPHFRVRYIGPNGRDFGPKDHEANTWEALKPEIEATLTGLAEKYPVD